MGNWFSRNFRTIIYIAFLVPIITVAIVSISHVTVWYGISNPLSWAVYLSIGIEIAALSALAAISAQMGSKVYVPFGIVTLIQFVGNIFFAFEFIKIDSVQFLSWVELTGPILEYTGIEQGDLQSHRRFLAIFAGGMLPLISLSVLHMLVKFNEENNRNVKSNEPIRENSELEDKTSQEEPIQASDLMSEISRFRPSQEELDRIEELLKKYPHDEDKKQREVVGSESREETVEDDSPDLPDEARGVEPPSWMDEIPPPTEEDFEDWHITLTDGLDDNDVSYINDEFDEDHSLDMVMNDMVSDLSEEEINAFINETVPEPFATPEDLRKIEVILDELPSTPNLEFDVDVQITTPEPTKKVPNKYEQLDEYLNQTRSWEDITQDEEDNAQLPDKVEDAVLDIDNGQITISPTPSPQPNFVVREPISQDQEDPEKKN